MTSFESWRLPSCWATHPTTCDSHTRPLHPTLVPLRVDATVSKSSRQHHRRGPETQLDSKAQRPRYVQAWPSLRIRRPWSENASSTDIPRPFNAWTMLDNCSGGAISLKAGRFAPRLTQRSHKDEVKDVLWGRPGPSGHLLHTPSGSRGPGMKRRPPYSSSKHLAESQRDRSKTCRSTDSQHTQRWPRPSVTRCGGGGGWVRRAHGR